MPNHVVVVIVTVAVVVAVVADGSLLKHAVRLLATRGVGVSQSLVNGRTLGQEIDLSTHPAIRGKPGRARVLTYSGTFYFRS